jgi:hypothetical protein
LKTLSRYEEILLNEIRTISMPVLPQALKMLRLLKEGVLSASKHQAVTNSVKTGFCGGWQDDRTEDEIVTEITTHRTGFGHRRVQL